MKPGKVISRFEDNVVTVNPRLKILKTAVVVGENAGGKTCFMRSLDYLKLLFKFDSPLRMLKFLSYNYDTKSTQSFELTVLADNNMIYTYALELDLYSIVSESLYIRKANQDERFNKKVFFVKKTLCEKYPETDDNINKMTVRIVYEIDTDDKYISKEHNSIIKSKIENESVVKGLIINYLALIGVDIVVPFIEWINDRLTIELPNNHSINFYKEMEKAEEDLTIIKTASFLEIFTLVDSSIVAIEVSDEKPFEKTIIVRKADNGNTFKIELQSDSSGTREFFAWSIQLWKVLYKNVVLFADEIDKVLNAVLSEKIVTLIQGSEHKGQFVFSTHNVLHLNTNIYMKEQLNFITKQKGTLSSEMYSLADFKEYRYEKADVYDLYLKGILGGVPND
jgi:hypothetical protein